MTENCYSSFVIFMERRYRNLCLRKKNGKSFTVDLKILEQKLVVIVNLYLSTVQNSSALKIPNTNIIKI